MLFGTRTLRAGEKVRLTLRFGRADAVTLDVPVRAAEGKRHAGH